MTRALKKLAHLYVGLKRKDESNKFDTLKKSISAWTSPPTFLFLYNHNFKERTKRKLIYAS